MFRLPIFPNSTTTDKRMKRLDNIKLADIQSFINQMEFICLDEVSMLTTVHLGIILLLLFYIMLNISNTVTFYNCFV
jgi:hypothetical protein